MAYCDLCGNFDSEHTDGEPDLMALPKHKPELEFYYSAEIMNKWQPNYVKYDWGTKKNWRGEVITCMCQTCFNSMDKLGNIIWREK